MSWYDRIKFYYENGLWSIDRVSDAVGKVITAQQFFEITGQEYEE